MTPGAQAPFESVQQVEVWLPGFVCDARIRMAPGPTVRDAYAHGAGSVTAACAGLVPVADEGGTPEMASASLLRCLAESAWLPTALLPASDVAWEALSGSAARETLADGATRVSMDVTFGPQGEITRILTERYRDANGVTVLAPWEGHFGDDEQHGGMQVPMTASVGWVLPEGRHDGFRGRITAVEDGPPRDLRAGR